jgi:hypothetical protein
MLRKILALLLWPFACLRRPKVDYRALYLKAIAVNSELYTEVNRLKASPKSDLAKESAGIFDDALQMLAAANEPDMPGTAPEIRYRFLEREVNENSVTIRYQKQHVYADGTVTDVREGKGFFQESFYYGPGQRFDRGHGQARFGNWPEGVLVAGYIQTAGGEQRGIFRRERNGWAIKNHIFYDTTIRRWSLKAV